ncbi:hypothetical protein C366_04326 [Cryptococcus neoformans Tu401-1]|nr:hypothetical protein C366_04326 [Cryptococcus neoformans var. grubii Tu401-1]
MQLINSTSPDVIDVDTWAISTSPRYYERHFCNVLTTATLCSRLTIRPRDSAEYTGWTALAMTGHQPCGADVGDPAKFRSD